MAKIVDPLVTDEQVSASPMRQPLLLTASERLKFRDKVYTSRLLIVPDTDRTLPVNKGVVEVPVSDTDAVKFLKANEEFELLKE
ncbi:hypothetical protein [Pseudomonas sp. 10S4]|uniref:hypothetical protein n=1 Tax=Pseudomonas sp. 10S4 TaxID=3048583 RepID=UPI002AC90253|nr:MULTISPECIES: hypothetical protein [unclassified Pseudomonas]MEB0223587.1 hypothetical protein [Pseudomonas sp. 5S1]MEB0295720.1 hypothetical protein [Pseudomonas sp. 10S4]WPX21030.1 hypothetical protein RHM58_14905 [Pseudomonas sp. 10S4]